MHTLIKMEEYPMSQIKKSLDSIICNISLVGDDIMRKDEKSGMIMKAGATRINQGLVFKGYDGIAELFITYTHEHWVNDDGKRDKDVMLLALIEYIEIVVDTPLADRTKSYNMISPKIINGIWDEAQLLIPACIEYSYLMRHPYTDEESGKVRFKRNFPTKCAKLSIVKMKKAWSV